MEVATGVGTAVFAVVSKYDEGHEPGCAGLQPPGMEVATGVETAVEGVAMVLVRTMVAVADAQYSRPRALSSPTQACRSQEHATSGTPEATQERYVTWQGSLLWRLSSGLADTTEVRARARARVFEYILEVFVGADVLIVLLTRY